MMLSSVPGESELEMSGDRINFHRCWGKKFNWNWLEERIAERSEKKVFRATSSTSLVSA